MQSAVCLWSSGLAGTPTDFKGTQRERSDIPFEMHQHDGRDLPDLQLLGGVPVGLAVSAEHLVVVRQSLLLGEQPQAVLFHRSKHRGNTFRVDCTDSRSVCMVSVTACVLVSVLQPGHRVSVLQPGNIRSGCQ